MCLWGVCFRPNLIRPNKRSNQTHHERDECLTDVELKQRNNNNIARRQGRLFQIENKVEC